MTTVVKDPRKIAKVALTHHDNVEAALRGDVLTRAHKEFGYTADEFQNSGPLAKALVAAGITPLNKGQVNMYMADKAKTRVYHEYPALIVTASVCIGGYIAAHLIVAGLWPSFYEWGTFGWALLSVMSLLMGCVLPISFTMSERKKVTLTIAWRKFVFGQQGRYSGQASLYEGYIPVHILNQALAVKNECPLAEFFVYELAKAEKSVEVPLPDPFLEVAYGSERYFIAVWDEREFEAEM